MNSKLLDYYNKELAYMREMSAEFAAAHPKVAGRLGMRGMSVADPYVERMLEGFCFLSARTRLRLDAEFPRFTQRLLEVVHPNYVAPTPSMAVLRLTPNPAVGDLSGGFVVPRGSAFRTMPPPGEQTACQFVSGMDATLWPLVLESAELTPTPPDLPPLNGIVPAGEQVRAALRLTLRTHGEIPFCKLQGLNRLPLYLGGDERLASQLFELLHSSALAMLVKDAATPGAKMIAIEGKPVEPAGMEPEESLLPLPWNTFHGHNLIHEFFTCPARFMFLALRGLAGGFSRIEGRAAEIVLLLKNSHADLTARITSENVSLFCVPAINLHPKRADRAPVRPQDTEIHVVVDRTRPLDFEIFSIAAVRGHRAETTDEIIFRPLYHTIGGDNDGVAENFGRYFSLRRRPRAISETVRKYGARTGYNGSETYISLVDQHEAPFADDIRYLSIDALVTNRDLPRLLINSGRNELIAASGAPIKKAVFASPPTAPRPPFAEGALAWRLIRHLGFNYLALDQMNHYGRGGQALRELLRLFTAPDDSAAEKQIQSLVGSHVESVARRIPGSGPLVFGRGVNCRITVDESGFSGASPYLFGLILSRYLSGHVSVNSFVETELHSLQRGKIARWPARMGGRSAL